MVGIKVKTTRKEAVTQELILDEKKGPTNATFRLGAEK
jgi:hypothetical protein